MKFKTKCTTLTLTHPFFSTKKWKERTRLKTAGMDFAIKEKELYLHGVSYQLYHSLLSLTTRIKSVPNPPLTMIKCIKISINIKANGPFTKQNVLNPPNQKQAYIGRWLAY